MKRISTPTRAVSLFGAGKDGFKNGDLANGIQPTDLDADWFNQLQEETARLIEGAGIQLDGNVKTQLLQAVRRMSGGYVRTVTAGHTVLTADDAGIVLINAAAGAVTIALPPASTLRALPFTFRRIDATVNSVTVSVAGTGDDVIDGSASNFTLLGKGDVCKISSNGDTGWITVNGDFSSLKASNGYQKLPGGLILQWGSGTTNASGDFTVTFPIAFPAGVYVISGSVAAVSETTDGINFHSVSATSCFVKTSNANIGTARAFNWLALGT